MEGITTPTYVCWMHWEFSFDLNAIFVVSSAACIAFNIYREYTVYVPKYFNMSVIRSLCTLLL